MLQNYIRLILGTLFLQGCCLVPSTVAQFVHSGKSTVSVKVATSHIDNTLFAQFCVINQSARPIMLRRFFEWEQQPRLELTCSNVTGHSLTLKEDGLSRWPRPLGPHPTEIETLRMVNSLMGSHSSIRETVLPGSFTTFGVSLARYFDFQDATGVCVLGGKVEVLLGPRQIPTWVSFPPLKFQPTVEK